MTIERDKGQTKAEDDNHKSEEGDGWKLVQ
jgi:hypothetical protein